MFFEKNKFFQRVGWCSGRNHFYRNSEGVNRNLCKNLRNLLQDPAELVSGFRTLRQEKTRLFETVLLFFGSVRSNCWNGRPFFRLKHLKDFSARTYGALLPESWTVVRADKYVKVHSIGNI